MANRQTMPEVASEWPGFPSAAIAAIPLDGLGSLVETATNLAEPDSHAAPGSIDELTEAAKALAPPETPVGGGTGDSSITEDGVRLGAGAVNAMESVGGASAESGLEMTLDGDEVFLTTVGINGLPDAAL